MGYSTGLENEHCEIDRVGFAGHVFDTRDIRCYGPINNPSLGNFVEVVMVPGPFVDNPSEFLNAWNDPTGNIFVTLNQFVPTVLKFSKPTDGSNANTNFLKQFEVSWLKMVTAGYHEVDGKKGKLGNLKTLNVANC
jgi:hypothetical protein